MAKIFVALNNFCRIPGNYSAMPPFYESFVNGLKDAGNEVKCFQTKIVSGHKRCEGEVPQELAEILRVFCPDLCIFFNNNFWDVSKLVECPIVIYDVDSPLEWQNKEAIEENLDRYLFVYNQSKGKEILDETFHPEEKQSCYIPFFSELRHDSSVEFVNNIVFLGTNWVWKGYNFLNNFIRKDPTKEDVKKALEVMQEYIHQPLKPSSELYYDLENCPHDRIDFGNLSRTSFEISGLRRIRYLHAVADLGLEVNGYYWDIDMMNYFPELLACVRHKSIWTKEDSEKYYNSAKIAMNSNHIQAVNGFSFRVCDILSSNACLVSEKSADLSNFFPFIPTFESPAEAREQCIKLLNDESLRQDLVAQSHEVVDKNFRFANVLDGLEELTGMCLRTSNAGTLEIFPTSSEEHQRFCPDTEALPGKAKTKKLSPAKQKYFDTVGKHLGYDPYRFYSPKYIRIAKIPVFKLLFVSAKRKELYMGFLPLLSYENNGDSSSIRLLLLEKTGNLVRQIGKKLKDNKNTHKKRLLSGKKACHMRRLRAKLRKGEKIKVCLFVSRINCWIYDDIYRLLKESGKFEPVIVIKPFLSRGVPHMKECMSSTYEALVERGYDPIKGYDEETDTYYNVREELNPDIIFFTKFWKPHFHPYFYIDRFLDKMTLLTDYGYYVDGHYGSINFELQQMVDMYFYPSRKSKQVAKEHMINQGKNVVVTGSSKLDIMFDPNYVPKDVWKPQIKPKKRIIWAPHHEDKTAAGMYQLDAFYDLYEIMLELAVKYQDSVQIAFKPHPLLKVKLRDKWGEKVTAEYYQKWEELENGQLEDGEFVDLFLTSDAMILDCLSFIAEYSVTGKPALFTEGTHSRVLLNDMGGALYSMMYHAKDDLKAEVSRFIEDVVISGHDPLREQRLEFVKNEMMPPNGRTAAENVYHAICDYITGGGTLP